MKTYHRPALRLLLFLPAFVTACFSTPAVPIPVTPAIPSEAAISGKNAPPTLSIHSSPTPPAPTLPPTAAPSPSPTPIPRSSVFVISMDGAPAGLVYGLMEQGLLPHFDALAREGLRAEWLQSVDPPLTAPAHTSLASGDLPELTGIVSNAFHNPNDSFYWYRYAFEEPLDRSTPVWVAASRQGLTTATIFFPGASPAHIGQTADLTIGYGVRDAYSRRPTVKLQPAAAWEGAPSSFSPPLEGAYTIPQVARIFLLVIDSTDDGQKNYDRVFFSSEHTARQVQGAGLGAGEWGSLLILPQLHAGANFLVQEIDARQVEFYHTGVYYNTAAPRSLLEALNAQFGFFQAGGDSYALQHGWITEEEYLYQLEHSALWMAEVTRWVHSTYQPDLLFTWQEAFDSAGHTFFLRDARQPDYSEERAARYQDLYLRAAQAADEALEVMLSEVDLSATTILLASDHGMAPVHTAVYPNTLLQEAGLLVLDWRDYVVVDKTRAFAVASGGALHVYINLQDHERDGIVPPEDYQSVQDQIVALLSDLRHPETGEPVFQRVLRQEQLSSLGLSHRHAGDVFAQAAPGYHLDGYRGVPDLFQPAGLCGQHGYASDLPEMQALFIAAGAGVPVPDRGAATGTLIPLLSMTDLAPTIASLLGLSSPATGPGSPIPGLLYP